MPGVGVGRRVLVGVGTKVFVGVGSNGVSVATGATRSVGVDVGIGPNCALASIGNRISRNTNRTMLM